ncbi:MAG: hypothetical protein H0U75_08985 [Legionella sp.]|nr:hypothetical protein [Legionella sp.]
MKIFKTLFTQPCFVTSLLISILCSPVAFAQPEVCQGGDGAGLTIIEDCSNNPTPECILKACNSITDPSKCNQSAVMTYRSKEDHLWNIHGAFSCIFVKIDIDSPAACYPQRGVACVIKRQ